MFLYQVHPNQESTLLVVRLDLGEYDMMYHHMYQDDDHQLVSFSQNRIPTNDEVAYIRGWIAPLYDEFHVANLFRNSFENHLTQDLITVFTH